MGTLILYATKHGAAREIAEGISKHIDDAVVCDLKGGDLPAVSGFDCVIIGGSLYAGAIAKEAKAFLKQHADDLRDKRIGLFLSGMDEGREQTYFAENFPPDLLQAARATGFLGGIFDPAKVGVMGRFIMKLVAKQAVYTNTIDEGKIRAFAERVKA